MLLALFDVLVKDDPEVIPTGLRDEDGVAEVALDLGDSDVSSLRVLLAGEVEVLVLDADMAVVGSGNGLLHLAIVVFIYELLEVVVELFHAVSRDEDLEARVAARESLGDFKETPSGIFLKETIKKQIG